MASFGIRVERILAALGTLAFVLAALPSGIRWL